MHQMQNLRKAFEASIVPSANILIRDVMATVRDSLLYSLHAAFRTIQAEVDKPHKEACFGS